MASTGTQIGESSAPTASAAQINSAPNDTPSTASPASNAATAQPMTNAIGSNFTAMMTATTIRRTFRKVFMPEIPGRSH